MSSNPSTTRLPLLWKVWSCLCHSCPSLLISGQIKISQSSQELVQSSVVLLVFKSRGTSTVQFNPIDRSTFWMSDSSAARSSWSQLCLASLVQPTPDETNPTQSILVYLSPTQSSQSNLAQFSRVQMKALGVSRTCCVVFNTSNHKSNVRAVMELRVVSYLYATRDVYGSPDFL